MTIKHLQFDDSGTIAGTALTTSYATLLTLTDDADILFLFNATDVTCLFSIPSYTGKGTYTTKEIRLPAASSIAIDCMTNSKRIAKGTIQVKEVTNATSGEVTAFAVR